MGDEVEQTAKEAEGWVETPNTEYNTLALPLYSVNGIDQPQTLKVKSRVAGREVVMVDSGASQNFVSRSLIAKLGLMVDESVFWGKSWGWVSQIVPGGVQGVECGFGGSVKFKLRVICLS